MQGNSRVKGPVMTGRNFPKPILRALGLPAHTQEFTLRVKKNEIVEIECRYYPSFADIDLDKLDPELREFVERTQAGYGSDATCEHAANALAAAAAPAQSLLDVVVHEQA